jgi:hypothetical protein
MPKKKKPRSISFTFHMEGDDGRGVCVKLADSGVGQYLELKCRLANLDALVEQTKLSDLLFSVEKLVKKADKKRDKGFKDESSTMKMVAVNSKVVSKTEKDHA